MFVCRLDEVFGVGETVLESFNDLVDTLDLGEFDTPVDPAECEFFESISVSIRETKTWDIVPEYEADFEG